jgi:hypothetical protein
MTSRQSLVRLLGWGLVASVVTTIYAGISIVLGGTAPWLDVLFGAVLVLVLVHRTWRPDLWLIERRDLWLGWIFSALTVWVAVLWLFPALAEDHPDYPLFSLLGSPRRLLVLVATAPALRLKEAYVAGTDLPTAALAQLVLVCVLLGMTALAVAGTLRIVWLSLQPILGPPLDALYVRSPVRPGRWLTRLRWILVLLLVGLALGATITGLAAISNARIPQVDWQTVPIGVEARTVVIDDQDGTLYAVTMDGGVLRSGDYGASWAPTGEVLDGDAVQVLSLDVKDHALYAHTTEGSFRSVDGGANWHATSTVSPTYSMLDQFSTEYGHGVVVSGRGPEDGPVWAAYGGGALWARRVAELDLHQATILPPSAGRDWVLGPDPAISPLVAAAETAGAVQIVTAWDKTLAFATLSPGSRPAPLAWLALRAWLWDRGPFWPLWLAAPPILALVLALALTYANLTHPFGVPPWATLLARRRIETYVRPAALESAWPDWERAIRTELLRYGDVTVDDLVQVPAAFRRYGLRRYAQAHDSTQTLEARETRLRLLTGDRLRRWHTAWRLAARYVDARAGRVLPPAAAGEGEDSDMGILFARGAAVDDLASVLAEALGLTLDEQPNSGTAVHAYRVEAPALRLKLPPRFPLVFVADPQPSARTVQVLMDAVETLREVGYFALVVPLEPAVRDLDVAAELRQAVDRSPYLQDFIILGQGDVLDILVARNPTAVLVQRILSQVDLTVVSPFVISGPVPERVFFGREAEVKMLVESAGSADFAIVGNRKIGKTSLLQRVQARLVADRRVRPLTMDCQIVRDEAGFFAAFQSQNGLVLPTPTPEGLTAALTELSREGAAPILLMDEVDDLLANEKARGEPLASIWRVLAQAGICRFVFCGGIELARRLDDPGSAFFNFPQPLPLGYLSPETARLVLGQPMETLGIVLEEAEDLLTEVQRLTSGHPNLIQYLGRGLVEAANRHGERRVLLSDLAALSSSTDFSEYYLKTVWGQAGALERLITLLAPADGFQLEEMEAALAGQGVQVGEEALDSALRLLRIYAILEKRERVYTFVPRAFPEILRRTQQIGRLITIEKRRLAT